MKKALFLVLVSLLITGVKLNTSAQVLEGPPRDGIYDKQAIVQMEPIPYVPLREADIVWSRRIWRTIDMREKINQPFYYPVQPQNGWKSFVQIILDAMKEGTITAYSPTSDQFLYPITYKELMDKLETPQKVTLKRPDSDEEFDTVITKPFYASDVKYLRLKEDWVFDKQRSVVEVRILGICPVKDNFDEKGEFRATEPLFWVYFPECRPILAKCEQFNLKNGSAGRLSYDDVFMKRMFNSYIYKEENVYDRQINEYALGVDAMLESERAKESLHSFEQNLWEY
ncbi:MAG TPA: gliding motility protein GldN [Bacteroidales bacterium]|nr:gliding motility protein GldN [Bacteroidales bacterium]